MSDMKAHLSRLLNVLQSTNGFINYPIVKVFLENRLKYLPKQWSAENSGLNLASFLNVKRNVGDVVDVDLRTTSLRDFISLCRQVSILSEPSTTEQQNLFKMTKVNNSKLNFKKKLEIESFGRFLVSQCHQNGIERIVDIGCGLGHLLGWLSANAPGIETVGVDCNQSFCDKGTKIYGSVSFNSLQATSENDELMNIINGKVRLIFIILKKLQGKRTVLVSLHGCGDLQETVIRMFLRSNPNLVPLLLTVGCCYHKMTKLEHNDWVMSECLRDLLSKSKCRLNGSTLRMGAELRFEQYSQFTVEERRERLNSLTNRALVEVFYQRMRLKAEKEHRTKRRNLGENINNVVETLCDRYGICGNERLEWSECIRSIEGEFKEQFSDLQLLLDVQYSLQQVVESTILADRLQFLHEHNCQSGLFPLFPVRISPRNMCIYSQR